MDDMPGRWRRRVTPTRRATAASRALSSARVAARLRMVELAKGLGVHARTVWRWEIGETHPKPAQWTRIAAYLARFAPAPAVALALAAGVPSPLPAPPPLDLRVVEAAIVRAADRLDVAPRRVRAALRDIAAAVTSAHGTLDDLVRAVQEDEAAGERVERGGENLGAAPRAS